MAAMRAFDIDEFPWADTGCPDLGIPACLSCPLVRCRFDLPPKQAGAYLRAAALAPLLAAGMTAAQAAAVLGVNRRTVFRLKRMLALPLPVQATPAHTA